MLASRSREEARLHGPKLSLTSVGYASSTRRNSRRVSLNTVQGITAFRRGTIHHTGHGIADLVSNTQSASHSIIYTSKAVKAYRHRRALHHKHLDKNKEQGSSEQVEVQRPIKRFRRIVKLVMILHNVFENIVYYASKKGRHENLTSETTLSLRANTAKGTYEDLMFDPEKFKSQFKDSFPAWAKHVASKPPNKRTNDEIKLLVRLMKQLKGFRRYSPEVQMSFCRVLTYDQYSRRRVIIRKGHIAQRLYFIFSGSVCVTDDEDGHSVFANTEEEKVCLKRGDYFGELAFLKNIRRVATIVCLESTEFLSVSKEDFFGTGIDQCFVSEAEKRFIFLSNHPLFAKWSRNTLHRLAEICRVHEYHSEEVVAKTSLNSNWIYFILKGQCNVLRLVDLKNCSAYQKYMSRLTTASTSTGVNYGLRRTSTPFDYSTLKTYPIAEEDEDESDDECQPFPKNDVVSCRSAMNLSVHRQQIHGPPSASSSRCKSAKIRSKSLPHNFFPQSVWNCKGNKDCDKDVDVGVGVYMVLDRLTPGKFFGTWSIINQENLKDRKRETAEVRRLILVSGGCELIKMPKREFYRDSDNDTIDKLRLLTATYPSDNTLCHAYLKQSEWRCYREELVEDLVERNQASREASTGLRRTTLQQPPPTVSPLCLFNPKKSLSANFEYFRGSGWMAVNAVSPLVKAGQKQKRTLRTPMATPNQSSRITPVLRSTRRGSSSRYPVNTQPLIGENIVLAKGSHRSLVLTHGGIRCNEHIDEAVPGAIN